MNVLGGLYRYISVEYCLYATEWHSFIGELNIVTNDALYNENQ